ncbi:2-hydroxycyclohexane-1-carbonyl-CoA dehydrogenase [Tersicoccus solisilvae]|uniref:2-hydroxycyclohexane-1-carbonyl-CoA dehydrogenase n=1 Tax=Tersicoccus solisilvae TaxID=1882339 RepID=A0ABQ1PMY5_9MICC|nr:3-oxoacyl-ACP reductase family protein [Tersicoccus solisilvae]GGC99659.1 2-hydroxycyclohexane-1-carbonyl-CoA dehydrogenase [Tersicoccus solisilvae]
MGKLDTRIAIVTGAASGIGKGIALRLAAEGATVVVSDINEAAAKETAAGLGGAAIGIRTDVTSRESVDEAVRAVMAEFGRIDILVNNAGWDKVGPFLDSDVEDWDRVIGINLYGTLHCSQAVLRAMTGGDRAQERGTIVNIGSDAARVGSSGEAVYSAAKGGVVAFTKTLAREAARQNITVNAVCPGPADTPLFAGISEENPKLRAALEKAIPLRRLAQPEDLANAVAFLASDEAAYITGQTLSVSGGLTMI